MPISLKLQEISCCRHQKSTQEVEKPPYAKFQNCCRYCRMLQDVARWNIFSKMKYENRETTTIEIGVVDYPQKWDKKAISRNFMQCCRRPGSCNCCRNPLHSHHRQACRHNIHQSSITTPVHCAVSRELSAGVHGHIQSASSGGGAARR